MVRFSHAPLGAGLALATALAACSHNPPSAALAPATAPAAARPAPPAPPPAPAPRRAAAPAPTVAPPAAAAPSGAAQPTFRADPAGEWDWTATMEDQPYDGTLSLQGAGTGYTGTLRVSGLWDATVRSATLAGAALRVIFDSPEGELVMDAQFTDPNNFSGRVDVASAGASALISARRR